MTIFRPSIDVIDGKVAVRKAVFGDGGAKKPEPRSTDPLFYAELFKKHNLTGGHVFLHGPDDDVARRVLKHWPGGFQLAGDVTDQTAKGWLEAGADKVIVRGWLFPDGRFSEPRLRAISAAVGPDKLVVDISCRRVNKDGETKWFYALNSWKTITETEINEDSILVLSSFASEILVHPADENGKQVQIDEELVRKLAQWATVPVTYAGGARNFADLELVDRLSDSKLDLVIGSALDVYGGSGVTLAQILKWNADHGQDVQNMGDVVEEEPPHDEAADTGIRGQLTRMKTRVEKTTTEMRTTRPVGDFCAVCGAVFNFLWPRYECPNCGRFVCHDHSTKKAKLRLKYTASGPQRVCDLCFVELEADGRQGDVDWNNV
ncbi:hypothetical protein DFJ74DRAFT_607455 [Hyaloraphidium curvatum]|nr:hypothetical protein DFJ74DRAFT_607455 [Hyaloraphidium curvatum]